VTQFWARLPLGVLVASATVDAGTVGGETDDSGTVGGDTDDSGVVGGYAVVVAALTPRMSKHATAMARTKRFISWYALLRRVRLSPRTR